MRGYRDRFRTTAPVGSFTGDASGFGVLDLGGNVIEWTEDYYDDRYYKTGPDRNPRGPDRGKVRVLKGASWKHRKPVTILARNKGKEAYVNPMVGFRCAQ